MSEADPLRLGFGVSGPLGQRWFSEAKARALIEAAIAAGVRHFDTAPFYFDAEARLGAALPSNIFVSTKTGTRRIGRRLVKDFSAEAIRADVEASRRRLRRDRLDLLYLHGPARRQIDAALPTLEALKREGRVAAVGVCGEGAPLRHAAETGFDAIMGVYNLIDRQHEEIFAAAHQRGVLTVAVAPLAQGRLDPRFFAPGSMSDVWRIARGAFRGRYRNDEIRRVRTAISAFPDLAPPDAALGFVLANPMIDIVMTTTTKPEHLRQSIRAAGARLDPAVYKVLIALALDRPGPGS